MPCHDFQYSIGVDLCQLLSGSGWPLLRPGDTTLRERRVKYIDQTDNRQNTPIPAWKGASSRELNEMIKKGLKVVWKRINQHRVEFSHRISWFGLGWMDWVHDFCFFCGVDSGSGPPGDGAHTRTPSSSASHRFSLLRRLFRLIVRQLLSISLGCTLYTALYID